MSALPKKLAHILGLFVLFFIVSVPFMVDAATYTWDGGGVDENWSTCANWSSDICPLSGDSVIFSGTSTKNVTVDADITVTSFNMNAGYTGVLTSGSNLITIGGNFTQAAGTFNASAATTTVKRSFTYTGGTFNHNSGIVYFLSDNTGAATITSNAAVFNTVVFDTSTTVSFTTNIGSDMIIAGNLLMLNSLGTHNLTIQSSASGATRNLSVAGNFLFPSTASTRIMSYGSGATNVLNVILQGNLEIADSNVNFYSSVTFASSSNQTVALSAGSVSNISNWYDTGSGNLVLTANFVGSQTLNIDSAGDFNFVSTPYSFTAGTVSIAGGESFTASGMNMFTLSNDLILSTGTFNMNASTTITDDLIISGGVFNAGAGTTTLTNNFTHTSGTFNHDNGTVVFSNDNTGGQTITATSTVFNNVVFDTTTTVSITTSIASDMTIAGNLIMQNTLGTNTLTVQSSVSGTTRNLAVAGNFVFPSTANIRTINYGASGGTNDLNTVLQGNLDIADSNAAFYTNVTFASSSNQSIIKTAGSINSTSDWYDTGSGNLALTANFSGSQKLNSDSGDDFSFVSTAFTFTSRTVSIATSTSFTPSGVGSYIFSALLLDNGGTFNATASTSMVTFTQTAGVFNAISNATTSFSGDFTFTAGTFNHNNGIIAFNNPAGSGITFTPNSAVFNDVVLDMPGNISSASYFTSLGSNMTINGDLYVQNTNTNSGFYTFRSSSSNATRTISLAGDLIVPSTSGTATVFVGATSAAYPINVVLQGNMTLADSNAQLFLDVTFASSSDQTITKTAGTIDTLSDWYDTGSGNLVLTANFSGSQKLNSDSLDDFSFVSSGAYTFTSGSAAINTGTTWAPDGPSSYIFSNKVVLSTGTFNAPADSAFNGGLEMTGGVFNAPSGMLTIKTNQSYEGFVMTSGTFNHNNGTILFYPNSSGMVITPNGADLYNVIFDYITPSSNTTNIGIGSDMNILGSMTLQNNQPSTGLLKIRSSVSGTPRTITIAGDLMIASTSPSNTSIFFGESTPGTYVLNTTLYGNMSMNDSASIYANITFASSSDQTFSKTTGSFSTGSTVTINKPYGTALVLLADLYSTGSLNVTSGTLRTSGYAVTTAASSFTVGATGNLEIIGYEALTAPTLSTGSFVTYAGATSTTYTLKNYSYKNLTIQSTGTTYTLPAALTIAQNINIASGTLDVTASNYALNVTGNWVNTGTFTPRSGTVTLNGTGQSITGTSTFYNLTKSVVSADTLTFGANQTQTISNTWTANGASGNLLSLRSNNTGTQWKIDPQVTRTLSYIDVQDSNNINASAIGAVVGIVDSGNNLNWGFDNIPPGATGIIVTPATSTASVVWDTDEEATSIFKYGLTSAYGSASTSLGTSSHSVIISGLTPETVYHYAVVSSDGGGNTATTTDGTFTTNALPDTTAPDITTIATSTGTSTATISWITTENASSSVLYGTTISYGSVATSSTNTIHSVSLTGLTPSTEYHFRILAIDLALNASTTADMTFTTASFDPTPPTVSLTAPANSAVVTGALVAITADASDNTAVAGVQFKLNTNTNIGSEDTTSAYGVTWDSTAVADGAHTIIAVARDAAGNYATSSVVSVVVDNTPAVLSAGSPTTSLAAGTTNTTMSVTTSEAASCKYDTSSGTAYGSMSGTFSTTGGTNHSTNIAGLADGNSYTYYVRCSDGQSNVNSSDYSISFAVDAPVVIPPAPTPDPAPQKIEGAWYQPSFTGAGKELQFPQPPAIPPGFVKFFFKKDLAQGMNNADVKELQKFLNNNGFVIARAGAGSPGKETTLFGPATKAAVLKFQIAKKVKGANGRFGPGTRGVVNTMK